MPAKQKGLLLILGGAPSTPHVVEGLPGYFSPEVPHLVGDDYDLSLDAARGAAKDRPELLKLVEVSVSDVSDAEDSHAAFIEAGRGALLDARRDGRAGDDVSRTADENDALKEAK